MLDTSVEMKRIQREIIFRKTKYERFIIGAEVINFGRMLVVSNIKKLNPGISDFELTIAVLKRYYGKNYSKEEFDQIIHSFSLFNSKKKF